MDDDRIWAFERDLWIGGEEIYRRSIDPECLMALPRPPFVLRGSEAVAAVADTPRWSEVDFSECQVARPREGLIVIAYQARASRGEEAYEAHCTSTYLRLAHEEWRVVQHQQAVKPTHS
jgi:hypothetical protein